MPGQRRPQLAHAGHNNAKVRFMMALAALCRQYAPALPLLTSRPLCKEALAIEQQRASLDLLRRERVAGARVIPGHDADVFRRLVAQL